MLLLLGVLVRHLQRFTLGTCHAWAHVPAESILVCASNNLLQARAAEGLSNPNPNPNLKPSLLRWAPLLPVVGKLQQANCTVSPPDAQLVGICICRWAPPRASRTYRASRSLAAR